jgi:PIN domain nuclease of toxin-antitoxin system
VDCREAIQLGAFHGDPADRLIAATALVDAALIVTTDRTLRAHDAVTTLW